MCTATWIWRQRGYHLFFNRDERRQRGVAEGPRPRHEGEVAFLAPRDRDAGGTWLAVNELGLAVGLLNFYDAPAPLEPEAADAGPAFVSRGLLVRSLATAGGVDEVGRRMAALDTRRYRPFVLLALEPPAPNERIGGAAVFSWDGAALTRLPEPAPRLLSSSGYDAATAYRRRSEVLATFDPGSERALRLFHASHLPERGAFSPCMHRDDALTVSFSAIQVAPDQVTFEYCAGPPCVTAAGEPVRLHRRERSPIR